MRSIENLCGRRTLLPLYDRWRDRVAAGTPRVWNELLAMIGTRLEISAPASWPDPGADDRLVMIANHPFGIADGIAVLALAERLERPFRILLHADLMRLPELQGYGLPIDFSGSRAGRATNLQTRAEARRLLQEGVTIVIFPAGGVATAEKPFGPAEDLPWKQFALRLIRDADASVLPVYFEGQNSPLFHFVSRYSLTLRLSLLVYEFRRKLGSTIRATVGSAVTAAELAARSEGRPLIDELYLLVHRLAPGAALLAPSELLPRAVDERRRFPWDAARSERPSGRARAEESESAQAARPS